MRQTIGSFASSFQDMLIQMISSGGLGYVLLLHVQMYNINPMLPFLPISVLCILVHFFVTTDKNSNKLRLTRVTPIVETNEQQIKEVLVNHDGVRDVAVVINNPEPVVRMVSDEDSKFDIGSDFDSSEVSESDPFADISSVSDSD